MVAASPVSPLGSGSTPAHAQTATPISHIVVIDEENHSFDNILGKFCADVAGGSIVRPGLNMPCDGVTSATMSDGALIDPLPETPDITPIVGHAMAGQRKSINSGSMNGFWKVGGCAPSTGYACVSEYDPTVGPCGSGGQTCIPDVASLAAEFAVSDRTFEFTASPSWTGHMVLATPGQDGFSGSNNPQRSSLSPLGGNGWGCDSGLDAQWSSDGVNWILAPSCIPDQSGQGPYRSSPVPYVPTVFDSLDAAGLTWHIYGGTGGSGGNTTGYQWTICPTFYECMGGTQRSDFVPASQIVTDAQAGTLPSYSIVTPIKARSQHPPALMSAGDNWIGSVVSAIMNGPDWSETAIFITWDDSGGYYDHVNPWQYNRTWGVRVPMIIVSPYAKQGYTDSTPTTFISMMAFVEHTFGLAPLNPCATSTDPNCTDDTNSYDLSDAFDYSQAPLPPQPMARTPIPAWERAWLAAHPFKTDVT